MITPQAAVQLSAIEYWKECEGKRVTDAQKLWAWYYNDRDKVHRYIRMALRKLFKRDTISRMNVRVFNIVPRVVDKLCAVYKKPAIRVLDGGQKFELDSNTGKQVEVNSSDNKTYQSVLTSSTINKKSREWHKLGKLFNTVLVQPVWREEKKCLDFIVHTPAWTVVVPDESDYRTPKAFYYPIYKVDANGQQERVLVYWSKDEYCYIDTLGGKLVAPGSPDKSNPYGILPVAVLRFKETNDFWGEGLWDLVDGNEEVCSQVTNIYYTALLQSHGQPVATNLGLAGEPEIGPDKPIVVENKTQGEQVSKFEFVQANPMLAEVQGLIDWTLKTLQGIKGLSPQQYSLEASTSSGISKMIDSTDISEIREDDVQVLEEFEYDLFNVSRVVYNYHTTEAKISDNAKFSVSFGTQEIKKTADEKVKEREAGLKNNYLSLIDIVLEDHPEMNKQQAQEYLQQVEAEKKTFNADFQLAGAFMTDRSTTDTTPQPPSKA